MRPHGPAHCGRVPPIDSLQRYALPDRRRLTRFAGNANLALVRSAIISWLATSFAVAACSPPVRGGQAAPAWSKVALLVADGSYFLGHPSLRPLVGGLRPDEVARFRVFLDAELSDARAFLRADEQELFQLLGSADPRVLRSTAERAGPCMSVTDCAQGQSATRYVSDSLVSECRPVLEDIESLRFDLERKARSFLSGSGATSRPGLR